MLVLTLIAQWEWGAACVQVDMGSKVEIQRGTETLMLCKKRAGPVHQNQMLGSH